MVKDTMHSEYLGVPLTETWEVDDEEFFLDGPSGFGSLPLSLPLGIDRQST
jgi:hypothetical protein